MSYDDLDEWRAAVWDMSENDRLTTAMAVRNSHGTSPADTDEEER